MTAAGAPLLEALIEPLRQAEIESFLKLGSGTAPDQLFVALPPDGAGRVLHLQVMVLPAIEPPVIQFYVGLPITVTLMPEDLDRLARYLCAVNVTLPVGQFGLVEDQGLVYFRHNQPISGPPVDFDVFGWTVTMAQFVVANLGPLIERVAGGLDLATGRQVLAETLEGAESSSA